MNCILLRIICFQKLWSACYQVSKFDYPTLMENDAELLKWLIKQESHGATLLQNTPADPAAACNLANRIATVKYTHFGYAALRY